jgi:hypothetical protein
MEPRFQTAFSTGNKTMVERKKELKRRRHRRQKMLKFKSRLAVAKDAREREQIVKKIQRVNPLWTEAAKV